MCHTVLLVKKIKCLLLNYAFEIGTMETINFEIGTMETIDFEIATMETIDLRLQPWKP